MARIGGSMGMDAAVRGTCGYGWGFFPSGLRAGDSPIPKRQMCCGTGDASLPTSRSQRLDLTFEFRLEAVPSDEAKTTAVFNSPNRYIVTSNATGIICILRTETKKATRP